MRYVSNAVMVGFLTGVSVLVVLSQLGDFTGYTSEYSNKVAKTMDLLFNLGEVHLQTLVIGLLTVILPGF
jgi:SulP family sulfate permease